VVLAESEAAECPEGDCWEIAGAAQVDLSAACHNSAAGDRGHGRGGIAAEAVARFHARLVDVQRAAGPGRAVEEKAAAVLMAINYQYVVSGIDAAALDCRGGNEAQGGALGVAQLDYKIERVHVGVNLVLPAGGKVGPGGRLP
jgi:hypothetical protein